jgi:pyridoxamine 5'-phosphate oxidase
MTATPDPSGLRRSYRGEGLVESDLAADPVSQFRSWFTDAVAAGLTEPNAMVLATASADGEPSARTVLLKGYDDRGFAFFTNLGSRKGRDLAGNPRAALVFPWFRMERQVVVTGPVEPVSAEEARVYFATRPRGSQLGAWASRQSSVIPDRSMLDRQWARAAGRFPDTVSMPEFWGGFRVVPTSVEFWQGRPDRLHDRLRFRRQAGGWMVERLAP